MTDTEAAIQAALAQAYSLTVHRDHDCDDGCTIDHRAPLEQAIRRAVLVGRIEEASSAVRYCEAIGVSKESELWLGLNMRLAELEAEAQA